jgi:phosphate starvation-inducible PhoH-like protein
VPKKPVQAQLGDRSRIEVTFDKPQLLARVLGEYDRNLVAIENRLGVYIAARGNKLQIEGEATACARAGRAVGPLQSCRTGTGYRHWRS